MEDHSVFVPNVHFEKIPIKNLVSNQKYQRNLSKAHIANAAANFDPYQINPVKVSRRDGVNYVFNGQHTIEIVALVSGSRDTPVWCMIYDELVYEHEADIFANQQKFVKRLSPYEVFTANLEAGNDDQLIIRDLLESYGLSLGTRKAPCVICAVTTLEQIYQTHGYHMLSRVLRLCAGTWEGDENSFSANILNGQYLSHPETRELLLEAAEKNFIYHIPVDEKDACGIRRKCERNMARFGADLPGVSLLEQYPSVLEV